MVIAIQWEHPRCRHPLLARTAPPAAAEWYGTAEEHAGGVTGKEVVRGTKDTTKSKETLGKL